MVTSEVTALDSVPVDCWTPEDRARREAATRALLEERARCADEAERQRLVEEVVRLNIEIARGIARRFRGRGVEDEDLEQVACLGLMKAVRGFRPDEGVPFIGFAVPTIRGEVKRYFRDCSWTVRIPRRLQELQGRIAVALPRLEQELGREPTSAELAERIGASLDEVGQAEAARGYFTVLSLDRPAGADNDLLLADTVAGEHDHYVDQLEVVDMLDPLVGELSARDRRILELRFVRNWTQADIGRDIGVSQMQVSRLLARILAKLRTRLEPLHPAA